VLSDYIDNRILQASKSARKRQGRPSRGTPTPPGYGYLTRHLPRKVTLARINDYATDEQVRILKTRGKETQLYNTTIGCLGLDGRKNIRILQTNCSCRFRHRQREQQHPRRRFHLRRNLARPRTATREEGSPPRRRTPAPRLGHRSQDIRQGPGPSRHLGWPLRSLSQLSLEDHSPAHGLSSMTTRLVPLTDDLAKLQQPLLHLLGLGSHLLLGRRSLFSSRLRLCPRRHRCLRLRLIAEQPKVLKLSKRGLEWQGRPSRGTPTPLGYGYLTRHLPRTTTHTRLSGSASRQASPSARNEEETRLHAQIPRCSGLDSHNEQTSILWVPLQTELRFHSHGYEQPLHQRACGTTNSGWLAGDRSISSAATTSVSGG
jgi:hypothetical protein